MNFTSNVPAGTEVVSVFPFKSSSSPGTVYECRLYSNGATSCQCPGWTRRVVGTNGERECKHTKEVDRKKDSILAALNGATLEADGLFPFPTSGMAGSYATIKPMTTQRIPASVGAKKPTHMKTETLKPLRRFDLDA